MKKRKVFFHSNQLVEQKEHIGTETKVLVVSSISCDSNVKEEKVSNDLSSISHKKCNGANNWKTFLNNKQFRNNKEEFIATKNNRKETKRLMVISKPGYTLLNEPVSEEKSASYRCEHVAKSVEVNKNDNKPLELLNNDKQSKSKQKRNLNGKNKPSLTKHIAMDCEMVGVEMGVKNSILARVSLVNAHGDCIYDKFVMPTEPVLDYRTKVSGIRPEDLENAPDFKTVQKEVADIIKGRILIGHSLKHDLGVLFLTHPAQQIRDTSKFKKFKFGKTPALRTLAKNYLGVTIQDGEHSSVQDALATMQLYKMFKREWESSLNKKDKLTVSQKIAKVSIA